MKYIVRLTSLILCVLILSGCSPLSADDVQPTIIHPDYPEMASYPNEMDFIDPVTGEFDGDEFSLVYDAWRGNQDLRANIPQDYTENLDSYFHRSIPAFLSTGSENAVCSPLNVYIALAMLAETTDGDSRQEILDLMHADSLEALRTQASQVWKAHYCDDGASACILANSLWLDSGLPHDPDTARCLAEDYYASVFQCDLGSADANRLLQEWLDEQTGGLLKEQIQTFEMDPQTVLALASTIYYRAKWSNEFQPESTTEKPFHASSGDRTVTFMNRELSYGPYFWGDDFGAVSLRLEDGSKMWLILPDEGKSPADVLSGGRALDLVLGGWLETGAQKSLRVNLSLPKFDVVDDTKLNDPLKELGITSAFGHLTADFSPILPEGGAWLDTVQHAARVKVDEEGVEAAAYTAMMMAGAAPPPEEEMDFILDRPFLFVITSRDDLPLFAGVVNEP